MLRGARALALAPLTLAVAACSSTPEPHGASLETRRYSVLTDVADPELARRVGRLAERLHDQLAADFRGEPEENPFRLVVCTQRAAFGRAVGRLDQRDPSAVQGLCEPAERIVVLWSDDASGAQALAHELVHRFVATLQPRAPSWVDEGLARALALAPNSPPPAMGLPPRSDDSHPVVVRRLPDVEVWTRLDDLAARHFFPDADFLENAQNHDVMDCLVAAALVRYGLESQGWRDLRAIGAWNPDKRAFLEWLKKVGPETRFEHFGPLDLTVEPTHPSSQETH